MAYEAWLRLQKGSSEAGPQQRLGTFMLIVAAALGMGSRALWLDDSIWRNRDRAAASGLALLVLLPPLAAALISQPGLPLFLPRTLVGVLAPAYLVAGAVAAKLAAGRSRGLSIEWDELRLQRLDHARSGRAAARR